jgi:hypothetical protein
MRTRRCSSGAVVGVHDLLSSVTELTQRLRREQADLIRANARGRQVRDGTDESGSITIVLDDDGTARDVLVAADWRRRLNPAQVGSAVVAADSRAAHRRAAATADALAGASTSDGRGRESTEDTEEELARSGPTSSGGGWLVPIPLTEPASEPAPPRRSLAELSTAVLAAFEELERVTEPPPPVPGVGAAGAVRVTLAEGRLTECAINQAWLAHQDEVTLAYALREAVSAALTAAVAARRPLIEYQQRLDEIVADARATLRDLAAGVRR